MPRGLELLDQADLELALILISAARGAIMPAAIRPFKFVCIYCCVEWMHMQRTTSRSQCSSSTFTWILGISHKLLELCNKRFPLSHFATSRPFLKTVCICRCMCVYTWVCRPEDNSLVILKKGPLPLRHTSVNPALRKLSKKDLKFKVNLDYRMLQVSQSCIMTPSFKPLWD